MKDHLFSNEYRLEELNQKDPLVSMKSFIDWSLFERELEVMLPTKAQLKGGRPPYKKLLLFKIVFLQENYGLSDGSAEYQIKDRLSFMRFLDLGMADRVPDQNTIWLFKESLKEEGRMEKLFDLFTAQLRKKNFILNKGSIIDASIVKVPIQRNSREENEQIKKGTTPDWTDKKKAHKDVDAKWTSKNKKNYYGYKNHIKIDIGSKLITKLKVTSAEVHDSQAMLDLLDKRDKGHVLYADSAYSGKELKDALRKRGIFARVNQKGARNKSLTEAQIKNNHSKSKTRARVEHVFGNMKQRCGEVAGRAVGALRNERDIIMKNLTYNICRTVHLMKVARA
jgi:transposase, IS5 family